MVPRRLRFRLRLPQRGAGLILAIAKLFVIENRDGFSGIDAVAFSETHFENAPGRQRRYGGIVALDPAAQSNDVLGDAALCKEQFPDQKRHAGARGKQDEQNDEAAKSRTDGLLQPVPGRLTVLFRRARDCLLFRHSIVPQVSVRKRTQSRSILRRIGQPHTNAEPAAPLCAEPLRAARARGRIAVND